MANTSDREYEERLAYTLELMKGLKHKGEIKAALRERFGIKFRASERLMSRAKARLMAEGRSSPEMRTLLIRKLEEIASDNKIPARDRVKAIDSLCGIYGLRAPLNVHHTGTTSDKNDLDTRREKVIAAIAALREGSVN
jgi:hypothetical protein